MAGSRAAPRLLVGDLNMPSTVLVFASRRGWPETGRGRTWPNAAPTQQLDHILRNDPAGAIQPGGARVAAAPSATIAPWWSNSTSQHPDSRLNHQIRRLVLYVHAVRLSAVCAAQVRCRIQPGRLSAIW